MNSAAGSYLWGAVLRIDVLQAPSATSLTFYGPPVLQVVALPLLPAEPNPNLPAAQACVSCPRTVLVCVFKHMVHRGTAAYPTPCPVIHHLLCMHALYSCCKLRHRVEQQPHSKVSAGLGWDLSPQWFWVLNGGSARGTCGGSHGMPADPVLLSACCPAPDTQSVASQRCCSWGLGPIIIQVEIWVHMWVVHAQVDTAVSGQQGPLLDIAVSGLTGWVTIAAPRGAGRISMRVWAPRGCEVLLRPALPVRSPIAPGGRAPGRPQASPSAPHAAPEGQRYMQALPARSAVAARGRSARTGQRDGGDAWWDDDGGPGRGKAARPDMRPDVDFTDPAVWQTETRRRQ